MQLRANKPLSSAEPSSSSAAPSSSSAADAAPGASSAWSARYSHTNKLSTSINIPNQTTWLNAKY